MMKTIVWLLMPLKFKLGIKHEFSAVQIINMGTPAFDFLVVWFFFGFFFWSKMSLSQTV